MIKVTTTATPAATLTHAQRFQRFMDGPARMGEYRFSPVWPDDEFHATARDWFLAHTGLLTEYLSDSERAERLLALLEDSDDPSEDMDQMVGALTDALDAMKTLQRAYVAATTATPITTSEAEPERQALLYAIAQVQGLHSDQQEGDIVNRWCMNVRSFIDRGLIADLLFSVEHHVQREINLWPDGYGREVGGAYSEEEITERDAVRAMVNNRKARFAATGALIDAPASDVVTFIGDEDDQEGEAA